MPVSEVAEVAMAAAAVALAAAAAAAVMVVPALLCTAPIGNLLLRVSSSSWLP